MNTTNIERSSLWTARLELAATTLLIVVALGVGGLTVWDRVYPPTPQSQPEGRPQPSLPSEPVSIEGAVLRGNRSAKVALIEFSEFQCPFCARSARDLLPELERRYLRSGKVVLAWRHYPLAIHQHAQKAAEAAECAGREGKFWEFHDWAFANQNALGVENLRVAAKTLGLGPSGFQACLDGETAAKVKADIDFGKALFVDGTPTWFVGIVQPDGRVRVTERLDGARPLGDFERVINKLLASSTSGP